MSEPVSQILAVFKTALTGLASSSLSIGSSLLGTGRRLWQRPDTTAWQGDPLDIPGIAKAFDRGDLNADYEQAIADGKNPGTTGDVAAIKTQVDYVACLERAYRARQATPVRCLVHAGARRTGHGHARGVLLGGVVGYVESSIKAGGDAGGTP
jgi:hypothetical protein